MKQKIISDIFSGFDINVTASVSLSDPMVNKNLNDFPNYENL